MWTFTIYNTMVSGNKCVDCLRLVSAAHTGRDRLLLQTRLLLPKFYVGDLETIQLPAINMEHRQMIQDLEDTGLFETNMGHYYRLVTCLALALAGVISGILLSSSFAVHMLCAVVLGCFWNQCNFIGHDTGHNGITKNRKVDSLVGLFAGNMMTGISIGWWKVCR